MTDHESPEDSADQPLAVLERHRPIVRETDKRFSRVYGFGGAAVLGATLLVPVFAWLIGGLGSVIWWVLAPTVFLISLFVLRTFVNRERERLRLSVVTYCELNDLELSELREYYAADGIYPYFQSLFERQERT